MHQKLRLKDRQSAWITIFESHFTRLYYVTTVFPTGQDKSSQAISYKSRLLEWHQKDISNFLTDFIIWHLALPIRPCVRIWWIHLRKGPKYWYTRYTWQPPPNLRSLDLLALQKWVLRRNSLVTGNSQTLQNLAPHDIYHVRWQN